MRHSWLWSVYEPGSKIPYMDKKLDTCLSLTPYSSCSHTIWRTTSSSSFFQRLCLQEHGPASTPMLQSKSPSCTACMRWITFYRIHYTEAHYKNTTNTQAYNLVHSCFDTLANQIHTRVHTNFCPEFNWF